MPRRVVHLTTVHPPFDPRIFWKEARSLVQAGYDVHLVAPHDRHETVEGVALTPLPKGRGRYRRAALQRYAYERAKALAADLYHFHDPELIPLAYALKRRTGARVVYDMHENYRWHGPVEGRLLRALERWCFTWVDHVVLAEESFAAVVEGHAPYTHLLNYFLPREAPPPAARTLPAGGVRTMVYTGVISDSRGLDLELGMARCLRDAGRPWRIQLVGRCNLRHERERAEARIAREGLGGVVDRVGWDAYVPWPRLLAHLHEAHVGLCLKAPESKYADTLPTKFYEYLYYGLPLVCSDVPAWRRFVEAHGCGAVIPFTDASAVLPLVERWDGDPGAYARMSRAALDVSRRFLWAEMEARLVQLYRQLLP